MLLSIKFVLYINFMFAWISSCWEGSGNTSPFEKARIRSVRADWQVPDDADLHGKTFIILSAHQLLQRI